MVNVALHFQVLPTESSLLIVIVHFSFFICAGQPCGLRYLLIILASTVCDLLARVAVFGVCLLHCLVPTATTRVLSAVGTTF
jgi:hypothetical protein